MGQQGYSQVDKLKGGEGWGRGGGEAGRNQKRQMEQALKIKLVRKREWRELADASFTVRGASCVGLVRARVRNR
jgi:hypothetical protein